jgi:hypothetical protein
MSSARRMGSNTYFAGKERITASTLPNGRQLAFLHLNGDADVRAMSPERIYACGSATEVPNYILRSVGRYGKVRTHHSRAADLDLDSKGFTDVLRYE